MGLSRRSLLGSAAGLAAAGLVAADQLVARPAYALDPDGMESKMLFGDAHAGAAAVPLPSGNGNYHSIRVPAIIAIPGTSVVVAVAEGRPYGVKDNSGNFNLLYRRSTDSGVTWSAVTGLVGASDDSWGNGTLVYDPDRNELCCFMLRKRAGDLEVDPAVYIATSADRGATWSSPVARPDLERNQGDNDFIGPGNGIRRSTDGTLFVPAKGRLIYRPPGGDWQTSRLGHGITTGAVYGEGTVAERGDGKLILNYRATDAEHQADASRRVAIGHPGNWDLFDDGRYWRAQIIDSWSHAAQISHTVGGSRRLIFLNSASRTRWNRYAMKLRASTDDGETWATYGRLLSDDPLAHEGDSVGDLREGGYSALASTGSGIVYALVEARRVRVDNPSIESLNNSPCAVVLRRFDPSWITVQA